MPRPINGSNPSSRYKHSWLAIGDAQHDGSDEDFDEDNPEYWLDYTSDLSYMNVQYVHAVDPPLNVYGSFFARNYFRSIQLTTPFVYDFALDGTGYRLTIPAGTHFGNFDGADAWQTAFVTDEDDMPVSTTWYYAYEIDLLPGWFAEI